MEAKAHGRSRVSEYDHSEEVVQLCRLPEHYKRSDRQFDRQHGLRRRILSGSEDILQRLEKTDKRVDIPFDGADNFVAWRCWGRGPAVVLLHGDYGSWTHFIRNIKPLAERYQLLVPDMPGYGDSGLPVLQDLVVDSAQIMADGVDALIGDDADYDIIGFSYGGIHAGHMAAIHRGRVRRVVLIGAGGMGVDAPVEYKRPMKRLSRDMDWPTRR